MVGTCTAELKTTEDMLVRISKEVKIAFLGDFTSEFHCISFKNETYKF